MLTVAEVDAFMVAPKRAVSQVDWRPGLTRKEIQWWDWDCAVEINGAIPENTRILLRWRPDVGSAAAKYSCGVLFQNERVYAVDFDPNTQHTNKVGLGRPHYRKRFGPGTHEHTWSEDGGGYAEPMRDFVDFASLFEYFCNKATFHVEGGFKRPPSQQLSLGLI